MIYMPDVNVWVALTSNRHVHHALANKWVQTTENDQIAFCRITELGFLRLLTNSHVMGKMSCHPLRRGAFTMNGGRTTGWFSFQSTGISAIAGAS
jgi:hypothetical protein